MNADRTSTIDESVTRSVTGFAAVVALSFAIGMPGMFYWSAHQRLAAELSAEARVTAASLSDLVNNNPALWRFEGHRIAGLLGFGADKGIHSVLDESGDVVASVAASERDAWPIVTVAVPFFDAGLPAGRMEITHSLRDIIIRTAEIAVVSLVLALAAFVALRVVPLRMLERALQRASHLATHDALTSLPNRALFGDRLDQALARARRESETVAVLLLDLDQFKDVNDTLGHGAGDLLLQSVTGRLRQAVRESETVARLGGDEFGIIQVGTHQPQDAAELARRLTEVMSAPFQLGDHHAVIGVSIGVSLRGGELASDAETLQQEADVALYRAKAEGRGTYRFFEALMHTRLRERKALEADLRLALATESFELNYQPQVDLEDGRIVGAEALLRWHHPIRGTVPPDDFITIAEETGLIAPIGEWVLRGACREAASWPAPLGVAVNVSPVQFRQPGFVACVAQVLKETGLAPSRLELEVTEGIMLTDTDETLATLARLRDLGVTLGMDDFGTGYSSLGYLLKFRFDKIKIDRSFVHGLSRDGDAVAIVRAVVAMCRSLGIRSNAEGVEDAREAQLLRDEGCEEVQGFHFGLPMSAERFNAFLAAPAMGPSTETEAGGYRSAA